MDTMNHMTEEMTKTVSVVKITVCGGKHGSLALVQDNADYQRLTIDESATANWLYPLTTTETAGTINTTSTTFDIINFQDEHKKLQKTYKMQEAVTDFGVERIVAGVDDQYIEELSKNYFGYSNSTTKEALGYL